MLVNTWAELQTLGGKSMYHYRMKTESSRVKPIIDSQPSLIDHRNSDVHTDQWTIFKDKVWGLMIETETTQIQTLKKIKLYVILIFKKKLL